MRKSCLGLLLLLMFGSLFVPASAPAHYCQGTWRLTMRDDK